jgi:hypothetical protein
LTILDSIVADIESSNIDDVAAYFAALWYSLLCALWLTLGGTYVMIFVYAYLAVFCADGLWRRGRVTGVFKNL